MLVWGPNPHLSCEIFKNAGEFPISMLGVWPRSARNLHLHLVELLGDPGVLPAEFVVKTTRKLGPIRRVVLVGHSNKSP